jgi:hypothetical protein
MQLHCSAKSPLTDHAGRRDGPWAYATQSDAALIYVNPGNPSYKTAMTMRTHGKSANVRFAPKTAEGASGRLS